MSQDRASNPPAAPPPRPPANKPKRPMTAYNFFFRAERQRILDMGVDNYEDAYGLNRDAGGGAPKVDPALVTDSTSPALCVSEEGGKIGDASPAVAVAAASPAGRWNNKRKRPHGKVSFERLGRIIGRRWKEVSEEELSLYTKLAEEDSQRYRREKNAYSEAEVAAMCMGRNRPRQPRVGGNDDGDDSDNEKDVYEAKAMKREVAEAIKRTAASNTAATPRSVVFSTTKREMEEAMKRTVTGTGNATLQHQPTSQGTNMPTPQSQNWGSLGSPQQVEQQSQSQINIAHLMCQKSRQPNGATADTASALIRANTQLPPNQLATYPQFMSSPHILSNAQSIMTNPQLLSSLHGNLMGLNNAASLLGRLAPNQGISSVNEAVPNISPQEEMKFGSPTRAFVASPPESSELMHAMTPGRQMFQHQFGCGVLSGGASACEGANFTGSTLGTEQQEQLGMAGFSVANGLSTIAMPNLASQFQDLSSTYTRTNPMASLTAPGMGSVQMPTTVDLATFGAPNVMQLLQSQLVTGANPNNLSGTSVEEEHDNSCPYPN